MTDEELVQNTATNEKFVKNFVVNAKIDPKFVMGLSIFKIGGWNSVQPSNQIMLEEFIDENGPWMLIGIPSRTCGRNHDVGELVEQRETIEVETLRHQQSTFPRNSLETHLHPTSSRRLSEMLRRQSWQMGQEHVWKSRCFPHLAT